MNHCLEITASSSIINWIKNHVKSHQNASNHWKDLVIDFLVIQKHLAWRVGTSTRVKVGLDAIMICNTNIFLHEEVTLKQ